MDTPDDSASTIGRALDEFEAALFVGREDEIYTFRRWLGETDTPILNVHGRGGIGKSSLLHAFARAARAEGRPALCVDVDDLKDPDAFWPALAPDEPDPFAFVREEK